MKFSFLTSLFLSFLFIVPVPTEQNLPPCPNSPNCVSTQALKKRKQMKPFSYSEDTQASKQKLMAIIAKIRGSKLIEAGDLSLQYTFTTKLGKFTDDVQFLFDEEKQLIHFRSASRKGWHDLGANRRRMKKIGKLMLE